MTCLLTKCFSIVPPQFCSHETMSSYAEQLPNTSFFCCWCLFFPFFCLEHPYVLQTSVWFDRIWPIAIAKSLWAPVLKLNWVPSKALTLPLTLTLSSNSCSRTSGWIVFYCVSLPTLREDAARIKRWGHGPGVCSTWDSLERERVWGLELFFLLYMAVPSYGGNLEDGVVGGITSRACTCQSSLCLHYFTLWSKKHTFLRWPKLCKLGQESCNIWIAPCRLTSLIWTWGKKSLLII